MPQAILSDLEKNQHDDQNIDKVGSRIQIITYTLIIAIGGIIFGYDIGTIGGLIDLPTFKLAYGDDLTNPAHPIFRGYTKGILIGISAIGSCFGGLLTTIIIPPIGLRYTIFISSLSYFTGNIISLFAKNWIFIAIGRVFNGLSIGLFCVVCPMLISDLSPTNLRGRLVSILQLMTTIGIMIGALTIYLSDYLFKDIYIIQFKVPLIQGLLWCVSLSCLIWLVPESPAWILRYKYSIDAAKRSIAKARALEENDASVMATLAVMFDCINPTETEDQANDNANSIIHGRPRYLLRTITGVGLLCFQQCSGINYFFFFGTTIFSSVVENPYLVPVYFSVVNLVFSVLASHIVDKVERTKMLMLGSGLLAAFIFLFSTLGFVLRDSLVKTVLMIILSCSFIAAFSISWGPIAAIMVSEIYPPTIKVKAMSICGSISWFASFVVSTITPCLSKSIGFGMGYVFFVFLIASLIFVYMLVPETKNIPIIQLDQAYEKHKYSRRTVHNT